jgi:hypothetical protein
VEKQVSTTSRNTSLLEFHDVHGIYFFQDEIIYDISRAFSFLSGPKEKP